MIPAEIDITPSVVVPLSELSFRAVRSAGPGGQHVNKVSTKIELRFNVRASAAFTEEERARVLEKLASRLDAGGGIRITAQESRSQRTNKLAAIEKLRRLLRAALQRPKPRKKSLPGPGAREERMREKRIRSSRLENRRPPREE